MYNIKELLNLLAMHFGDYNENSNIGKLFQTFLAGDVEFIKACEDMKKVVDLDQAKGKNLDLIHGVNKDLKRGNLSDEKYKERLKIETKVNNSDGNITTLQETAEVLLGEENYKGIEETFNVDRVDNNAGVLLKLLLSDYTLPIETFERAVCAGVKTFYELIDNDNLIGIEEDIYNNTLVHWQAGTQECSQQLGVIL